MASEPTWNEVPIYLYEPTPLPEKQSLRPQELYSFLLNLLRLKFSDAEYIDNDNLTNILWTNTYDSLVVDPGFSEETISKNRFPAIYLVYGGLKSKTLSIDNGEITSAPSPVFNTRDNDYSRFYIGNFSIVTASTEPAESQAYADEITYWFTHIGPLIKQELGLSNIDIVGSENIKEHKTSSDMQYYQNIISITWGKLYNFSLNQIEAF